jgi:hypothetical protein
LVLIHVSTDWNRGGLELICGKKKTHELHFEAESVSMSELLLAIKSQIITERPEFFLQGESM